MIPTSEIPIIQLCTLGCDTTAGKKGSEKRTNPYVPIFNKTPARMTDPAVGASTCASGSHVWNGNSGTLIANATVKARNGHSWSAAGTFSAYRSTMSKLGTPTTA